MVRAHSRVELEALNAFAARKTPWYRRDPLAKREKRDYRRFMNVVDKHIVFYSERSGFYKYFQCIQIKPSYSSSPLEFLGSIS